MARLQRSSVVDRWAQPGRPSASSKHRVVTDAQGIRLAVSLTGEKSQRRIQLLPLVGKIPSAADVVGRPDALLADRGYDHEKYRRLLRQRGIRPVIAEGGVEHGSTWASSAGWSSTSSPGCAAPTAPDPLGATRRHPRGIHRPPNLLHHPPPRPTPLPGPLRRLRRDWPLLPSVAAYIRAGVEHGILRCSWVVDTYFFTRRKKRVRQPRFPLPYVATEAEVRVRP
ncbi:transposase [Streptomyces sp900105245]|uniref:Transposase n=1 Tax=Streptomyces sp. 900105245 TaxID=3154379 RepID=A0ABV1ULQ3_9ACTN